MNSEEIKRYQKEIKPWVPKCDVTIDDVVVCGLVDESVKIANRITERIVDEG